ncbi:hypothetical protein [Pseudomonas citri]|uniref:hypothetical protein n=1 Tax=Pseudomonas citri TaxID=2978349 RepID=UPI0021B5BEAE|nr:hypothetical protein [Pseudomonas citri]
MATSDTVFGMVYSPTWTTWSPPYSNSGPQAQFSDSDFFNDSFQALWNTGQDTSSNAYRNDIGVIGSFGFNLVRLYDWGATRGWNGTYGAAHISFLDHAQQSGVKVMVPISNYFLSDDTYAWNGKDPDASYSFDSAPPDIQSALQQFVSSVVVSGDIHPAVHSFSVGNEIDINTFVGQGSSGPVSPGSRLARVIWWIVNLQLQISTAKYRYVLLTSPISNADQGNPSSGNPPLSYWFQAFLNGVTTNTHLPEGTTGGGNSSTFSAAWAGIGDIIGYNNLWYFNSVNIYQVGEGLTTTLGQYDNWSSHSTTNSLNWPGQQFSVPLLLSEIGVTRSDNGATGQQAQFTTVTQDIVQPLVDYLASNTSSYLMGFCLYEFSDEVTLNANWGLYMAEPTTYPSGNVLFSSMTGTTAVSYGEFSSVSYPVDQLFPVESTSGTTLMAAIQGIIT